jgi:tetratricopeptide (TPR) repeat protein
MVSHIPTDRLTRLLLTSLLCGALAAADMPTKDEWAPVEAALTADQPDAESQLAALVKRFPQWTDGQRELAKLQLRHGETAAALESAQRALSLDAAGEQVEAACVQTQALTILGRNGEALAAVSAFKGKDKGGWLHYYGAKAALAAKDTGKAESLLKDARDKAVNTAPPEFFVLEARIDQAKDELPAAKTMLEQASVAKKDVPEIWYELGRVELAMSQQDAEGGAELADAAVEHFERALRLRPEDVNVLYGVGYARYEQAKRLMQKQDNDSAGARLRDAVAVLDQAVTKQPEFGLAHDVLGNVLVQLERFQDAIPHLRKAMELGIDDRASRYNLAYALAQSGDRAGAQQLLVGDQAQSASPEELVLLAMNAYHGHDFVPAERMLSEILPKLDGDPARQAAALRFIGHARRQMADKASSDERERLLDDAADAYGKAGDLKDRVAREDYLALQTGRNADLGYAAGWRYLGWKAYLSPTGWSAVLGNYGSWLTGDAGIGGAWNRHPGHVVGWGMAAGLPLLLFLAAKLRGGGRAAPEPAPRPKTASVPTPRASSRSAPTERPATRPAAQKAATEATRKPSDPAVRRNAEPRKTPTRSGSPRSDPGKAETEDLTPNEPTPALERKAQAPRRR